MGKKRDTLSYPSLDEGLYKLMREAGFTSIESLSKKSGVSARTIFNCQYNLSAPTNGTVVLLARALKVDPSRLRSVLSERG
jgi:lambda repressor-like predicted transcriptional regulator